MARICASVGTTCVTPVTLRLDERSSGTIFACTGAATRVKTTGMSLMYGALLAASCGPTTSNT